MITNLNRVLPQRPVLPRFGKSTATPDNQGVERWQNEVKRDLNAIANQLPHPLTTEKATVYVRLMQDMLKQGKSFPHMDIEESLGHSIYEVFSEPIYDRDPVRSEGAVDALLVMYHHPESMPELKFSLARALESMSALAYDLYMDVDWSDKLSGIEL